MKSFFLIIISAFIFLIENSSYALQEIKIHSIYPEELNYYSLIEVCGENFQTLKNSPSITLSFEGNFKKIDGEEFGNKIEIPLIYVNSRTLRGKALNLIEKLNYEHIKFSGNLRLQFQLKKEAHSIELKNITFDIFPLNLENFILKKYLNFKFKIPILYFYIMAIFILSLVILAFFALFAGITSWAERRIAGRIQSRIGPNRVGPQGFFQWIADGLKCFFKEDFIPPVSFKPFFRIAPYFVMTGVLLTFVTLPFGQFLILNDLNVGIFYIIAVTGFVVIGIILSGFSSNNKWSLLGGFRSAAQIISYEIPSALAILSIVALTGSLSMQKIIEIQGGSPWQWFIFYNPFTFILFFIFFTSSLAEGNRTPFDLPEAEQELVSGYNTEYSGMRFVFFFFAEWGNIYVISAILTTLFLGGWQIPFVPVNLQEKNIIFQILGWLIFTGKALSLVFVIIWLRWTLPRVRIDQLMVMCWKYLVPVCIFAFILNSAYEAFVPQGVKTTMQFIMFFCGILILFIFAKKVYFAQKVTHSELLLKPFI